MKKMPKSRKASRKALKIVFCTIKKLNFEGAKPYMIVERASGIVVAREMSRHVNPAHDAFLKGYNLIKNQAVACK